MDGTGRIRYTEFIAATIEAHGLIGEERLAEAFDRLDGDDSGFISAENITEILGDDISQEEIDEIIAEADLTKDNKVSYVEFLALWDKRHTPIALLDDQGISLNNDKIRLAENDTQKSDEVKESAAMARKSFLQQKFDSIRCLTARW